MAENGIIQFNVMLLKPLDQLYSIKIETVFNENDEYCKRLNHCVDHNEKVFNQISYNSKIKFNVVLQSVLNFTLPHNPDFILVDRAYCYFQFDCAYNISINTPTRTGSLIYHVEGIFDKTILIIESN